MTRLAFVLLAGCAAHVAQDAHTGRDGTIAGATELSVDHRAIARGIVTYPGGDRVDWYAIRVARPGDVAVELTWRSPRPGLRLDFDMFDDVHRPIRYRHARAGSRIHRDAGLVRDVVYVRVYARGRGDAGRYRLTVTRTDPYVEPGEPWRFEVPDPPDLPRVPEPQPCDPFAFDPTGRCPTEPPRCPPDAPPSWPGCSRRCPTPPDVNIPACRDTMPCPDPPDPRVRACSVR